MRGPAPDEQLLALVGPTAVGKTDLSLCLAERIDAEIVSVDSMQVYREMDIGTAKPTPEEQARVPHHLIDVVPPSETFSAGRYRDAAIRAIGEIRSRGKRVLLVGGTGLYLRTLVRGLCDAPPADEALRARLHREADDEGTEALLRRLRHVDPEAAGRIRPGDLRRIVRALEVHMLTGVPLSEIQRSGTVRAPFRIVILALTRERDDLYARINRRVDGMMAGGLVAEVRRLLERHRLARGPRQALGYREIIAHLDGTFGLDEAIGTIKTRTRRYAKRQLTWFRSEAGVRWVQLPPEGRTEDILDMITPSLANFLS